MSTPLLAAGATAGLPDAQLIVFAAGLVVLAGLIAMTEAALPRSPRPGPPSWPGTARAARVPSRPSPATWSAISICSCCCGCSPS